MPVRDILQMGHPTLWETAEVVRDLDSPEVEGTITDLRDTLIDVRDRNGFGRGIAAPQIDRMQRIIYIRMPDGSFDGPMINPRITERSEETFELWDDCLSFPNLVVKVERSKEVTVAYEDQSGVTQIMEASGDLSELLQHEIDHLDGILATQRAISTTSWCTRAEWERRFSKKQD